MVAAQNARKEANVLFNVINGQAHRHGLQENTRSGFAKGDGGAEDDKGDDERNGGVGVKAPGVVRQPDEESGGNDADIAEGVAHDVQENAAHVEV